MGDARRRTRLHVSLNFGDEGLGIGSAFDTDFELPVSTPCYTNLIGWTLIYLAMSLFAHKGAAEAAQNPDEVSGKVCRVLNTICCRWMVTFWALLMIFTRMVTKRQTQERLETAA